MKKKSTRGGAREGAGRPREYEGPRAKLSIMIDVDLLTRLDTYRAKKVLTRGKVVETAIERYLRGKV